ncbi:MAG: cation transporter [Chthoniobacterales bacterium]
MNVHGKAFRLPPKQDALFQRARRLEWISIFFLLTIIAAIGITMGSSEAMKAVWIEDVLSLVPPVAILIDARYRTKDPTDEFPYGYRRATLIAFLTAAVALLAFGLYILIESATTLISAEHPTIGTVELFGRRVWLGWPMIAALIYSVIPPLVLGRMKLPLARELHHKALQTDANLNKGDWLTGIAGVFGILGIGLGFWWADALAAAVIAIEILRDGVSDLRNSIAQLMNKRPTQVDTNEKDPVLDAVEDALKRLDWVRDVRVRLREDGDVLTGEAFIVPCDEADLLSRVARATEVACGVDWRLHDINVVPVRSLQKNGQDHARS